MWLFSRLRGLYPTIQKKLWVEQPCVVRFLIDDSISLHQVAQTLSSPWFSDARLVEIDAKEPATYQVAELVGLLFKKLPKLSYVSLITNPLNSARVVESIPKIGQVINSHTACLDIVVSLSGSESSFSKAQDREANFENLVKLIGFIQTSNLVFSSRFRCRVTKENVYVLHDWLEFAIANNIYINYTFETLYPQSRSSNHNFADLKFEEKYHLSIFLENLIKFYEPHTSQRSFYRSSVDQLIYRKPLGIHTGQHREVTLSTKAGQDCVVENSTPGSVITPAPVSLKANVSGRLKNLESSISALKTSKALKPLKRFKQQLGFQRQMIRAGVDQATLLNPQPAFRFPQASTSKRKVLICGWYGTETLGDKAILGGVVNSIQTSLGDVELYLASLEALYVSQMTILQMPELRGCHLHAVAEARSLAGSMDLVVFGGGPVMAIEPLAEMIAIFQQAVEAGVPTLIAGCGVGPLGAGYYNKAIKTLLLHASHRIYRDLKSLELAQSLGVDTTNDQVAEDPAFTWLSGLSTNPALTAQIPVENNPQLLLGLRDWPQHQYAPELTSTEAERLKLRFAREVIAALELLLVQHPTLRIIPFPMCTNHIGGDDRWFYRDLFRGHSKLQTALDFTCLGAELNPIEAVKIFKAASVALTMRFHSLVFALAVGLPSVSVDYTLGRGKVKSLAEKHCVPQMSLDVITREFIFSSLSPLLATGQRRSALNGSGDLRFKPLVGAFLSSLS